MSWMQRMILGGLILRAPEGDGGGGGGTGGEGDKGGGKGGEPTADDLKAELDKLKKENEELRKAKPNDPPNKNQNQNDDLAAKAAREREAAEAKLKDSKVLEGALKFTMGSKDFLKNNEGLLPKNAAGIFEQADKETYSTAVEKAADIKVGLVLEFFALQENLDLLTESQKNLLADFKRLAKDVRYERVDQVYDSLFEPALERARAVRKATQLRSGHQETSDADAAYRKRMTQISEKHFLRNRGAKA